MSASLSYVIGGFIIQKYRELEKTAPKRSCTENKFSELYSNGVFLKSKYGEQCTARILTHTDSPRPSVIQSKSTTFDKANQHPLGDVVKIKCKNTPEFLSYRVNRNPNF